MQTTHTLQMTVVKKIQSQRQEQNKEFLLPDIAKRAVLLYVMNISIYCHGGENGKIHFWLKTVRQGANPSRLLSRRVADMQAHLIRITSCTAHTYHWGAYSLTQSTSSPLAKQKHVLKCGCYPDFCFISQTLFGNNKCGWRAKGFSFIKI